MELWMRYYLYPKAYGDRPYPSHTCHSVNPPNKPRFPKFPTLLSFSNPHPLDNQPSPQPQVVLIHRDICTPANQVFAPFTSAQPPGSETDITSIVKSLLPESPSRLQFAVSTSRGVRGLFFSVFSG